jgi:hypothetical protein
MFNFNVQLEDEDSGRTVTISKQFEYSPVWDELTEVFMDALKGASYCFPPNSRFAVVPSEADEICDLDDLYREYEKVAG